MKLRNWKVWLKAAAVRAVKTVAQTAVAIIGTSIVIQSVDWMLVASASVLSGVVSMLTSIAGLPEVKEDAGDEQ
ncbi:MAG: holin [Lachnospiraceae bacterium]|nr:holin [Lachnospiraceae bacterium]